MSAWNGEVRFLLVLHAPQNCPEWIGARRCWHPSFQCGTFLFLCFGKVRQSRSFRVFWSTHCSPILPLLFSCEYRPIHGFQLQIVRGSAPIVEEFIVVLRKSLCGKKQTDANRERNFHKFSRWKVKCLNKVRFLGLRLCLFRQVQCSYRKFFFSVIVFNKSYH